jgi:protein phosphatase
MTDARIAGRRNGNSLNAAWATDTGRVAENNEDSCLAAPEDGLFVVSDGMGGEYAGELASSRVVDWTPELVRHHVQRLRDPQATDVEKALRDAVVELNHRVREESSRLGGLGKMGATVALALVREPSVHVAHMGDSRAYLLHDNSLERLTHDHSVVAVLVKRGALKPEQAANHPLRAHLSRYVGMGGNAYADLRTAPFGTGDRLLLCTDGLTEALSDEDVARILAQPGDLKDVCNALIDRAEAAGSRDNITVLLVERASA